MSIHEMTEAMKSEFMTAFRAKFGFGEMTATASADAHALLNAAAWVWQASRASLPTWQPMDTCPKHVDVLFFQERNGVIPGRLTDADSFMTDKERDEWDGGEEAQFRIDAFGFGHWGVDRMEGSEAPTHWMSYPEGPEAAQ